MELWADKLVYSGFTALHQISQLKRSALASDFQALIDGIRKVRSSFEQEELQVNAKLASMRQEVQSLLAELESSYYSSKHRGRLTTPGLSAELQELAQLAMESS